MSWDIIFKEIGKTYNKKKNEEHLKLLEGLTAVHITNIAYAKAEIFPVEILSEESDSENIGSWIFLNSYQGLMRQLKSCQNLLA
ncbi:Uncharacterised protein [Citrobacter werkmanii]|uniref:hypothetical protein n=1 Tax=Citrobacter werkmanii TaxID=67827 RepID=UPI001EF1BA11|nr:hypothetical protein [Citrobacter werkmanii]CAC9255413.1 Uncharacterised protein [Citrobacter werkmanii]